MVVEVIIYDEDYPQGNSWKYGFADVDTAIKYMQKDKEHLQRLGGLTKRPPDVCNASDCKEPAVCAGLCEKHSF